MIDDTTDDLRRRLEQVRAEHRTLDQHIQRMAAEQPFDQLEIVRLKKRKLALKDQISSIENALVPDIIA